jgi:hypothetical protein
MLARSLHKPKDMLTSGKFIRFAKRSAKYPQPQAYWSSSATARRAVHPIC